VQTLRDITQSRGVLVTSYAVLKKKQDKVGGYNAFERRAEMPLQELKHGEMKVAEDTAGR
jgi:hypothetical protein